MARILMVLTSHAALGATAERTGLWLEEFTTPYYALLDAGHSVVLASPRGGVVPVDPRSLAPDAASDSTRRYLAEGETQAVLTRALPLVAVGVAPFDALFYPGGHGPMWDLAQDPVNAALLLAFVAQRKPVAAVCHGPAALLAARDGQGRTVFEGRRVTGFSNAEERAVGLDEVVPFLLQDRLVAGGGIYSCAPLFTPHREIDDGLITGQNPASAALVAQGLVELLA